MWKRFEAEGASIAPPAISTPYHRPNPGLDTVQFENFEAVTMAGDTTSALEKLHSLMREDGPNANDVFPCPSRSRPASAKSHPLQLFPPRSETEPV